MSRFKYQPVGYKVLILPDKVEDYGDTIYMPETVKSQKQIQQDVGTVIAMGSNAFRDDGDIVPKIGDKVILDRNVGCIVKDVKNKVDYKLVQDKSVNIILEG